MTDQTLQTPEILILILAHLPQRDLLLAQSVSSIWRDTIRNSKILMQALFLLPAPASSGNQCDAVQFNPLLLSKFPAFFEHMPHQGGVAYYEHGLGPWFGSHWAENLRPWPKSRPNASVYSIMKKKRYTDASAYPQLDAGRAAAYRHPKASWRQMLPCIPALQELQVAYHRNISVGSASRVHGQVRCWLFPGEDRARTADTSSHSSWLTFGMLHDIVEPAWFDEAPIPAYSVQFDWTFEDFVRPRRPILREKLAFHDREWLREKLPGKAIGGTGRLLVILKYRELDLPWKPKLYHGQFKLEGSVPACDEEYQF